MFITETNDDLRNAEEERLSPEFEELALMLKQVFVVIDFCGGLQFHPIDWILLFVGLAVPNYR